MVGVVVGWGGSGGVGGLRGSGCDAVASDSALRWRAVCGGMVETVIVLVLEGAP